MSFKRDSMGNIQGGMTLRLGASTITVGGRLDRSDVRKLRQWVQEAERYYETAGHADPYPYYDSGDWLSDAAAVTNTIRDVANSPLGTTVASMAGPYGAAVLGAANGAPMAVAALQKAGIPREHAVMSSALLSPVERVRREATARMQQIVKEAEKGNPKAQKIRKGLQTVMVAQLQNLLRERDIQLAAAQMRLAELGDPLAYNVTAGLSEEDFETAGLPVAGAAGALPPAAAVTPGLRSSLAHALNRARFSPQPSFRRLPARPQGRA